jgi:hypothetical protein
MESEKHALSGTSETFFYRDFLPVLGFEIPVPGIFHYMDPPQLHRSGFSNSQTDCTRGRGASCNTIEIVGMFSAH